LSEKNQRLRFGKPDPEIDIDYKAVTPPEPSVLKKPLKKVEIVEGKSSEFAALNIETNYNQNKYSNFIQDLSSNQNAVIDVNYHTKKQKAKLYQEQREIHQKQLELQRQQIILQ
jgi:hypothetical protein